jgi:hypothetical protein
MREVIAMVLSGSLGFGVGKSATQGIVSRAGWGVLHADDEDANGSTADKAQGLFTQAVDYVLRQA